jgi:hypothetical protein
MHVEGRSEHTSWTRPVVLDVASVVDRVPLPLPSDGLCAVKTDGSVLINSGWAIREPRVLPAKSLGHFGYCFQRTEYFSCV